MSHERKSTIRNLMFVDDDEADQMLYRRIVRRSELVENTLEFHAADDALEFILSDGCPLLDAIILDVNMPRMDGFEFLDELAKIGNGHSKTCVIIMLTTSLDPRDEERAEKNPLVKGFMHKPLTIEHLNEIASYINQMNSVS